MTRAEYREKNREKLNAAQKDYYRRNREACLARCRAWQMANKPRRKFLTPAERIAAKRAERIARKARLRGNGGKPSRNIKEILLIRQKKKCVYCKVSLVEAHIDHILPLALGGSSDDSNLQLLCPQCNVKKAAVHPVDFAQSLGMLL